MGTAWGSPCTPGLPSPCSLHTRTVAVSPGVHSRRDVPTGGGAARAAGHKPTVSPAPPTPLLEPERPRRPSGRNVPRLGCPPRSSACIPPRPRRTEAGAPPRCSPEFVPSVGRAAPGAPAPCSCTHAAAVAARAQPAAAPQPAPACPHGRAQLHSSICRAPATTHAAGTPTVGTDGWDVYSGVGTAGAGAGPKQLERCPR